MNKAKAKAKAKAKEKITNDGDPKNQQQIII
jgi:hypothetical protein